MPCQKHLYTGQADAMRGLCSLGLHTDQVRRLLQDLQTVSSLEVRSWFSKLILHSALELVEFLLLCDLAERLALCASSASVA